MRKAVHCPTCDVERGVAIPAKCPHVRPIKLGKRTRGALYVHSSAWKHLPPDLRLRIGKSLAELVLHLYTNSMAWFGKHADVESAIMDRCRDFVAKIHHETDRVSFLYYPKFDSDPHPALSKAFIVQGNRKACLEGRGVDTIDYAGHLNPPILHRKEEFVAEDYPLYELFAAITAKEEALGLYAKETLNTIGTRDGWAKVVNKLPRSKRALITRRRKQRTAR